MTLPQPTTLFLEDMMKATRAEAFKAIDSERDYQQSLIRRAGRYEEETKPLEAYVLYAGQYLNQVKNDLSFVWGPESIEKALNGLRKVAALAVAAMETHGAPLRIEPTDHPELPDEEFEPIVDNGSEEDDDIPF
jgi:hypothetical protein